MYMNYSCYQIILRVKHFYANWSGAKCWQNIYPQGTGLAVNGRILWSDFISLHKLDVLFMYCIYKIICILFSWLVFYYAYCYFNDMFYIHFVGSLEYWINEWIRDNRQNSLVFFFKQKEVAAPVTSKVSSLSYSSKRPLLEIIILWNYTITICITIDNAIINKLWKAPNPYFALQNSHGYMKEFLGNL